jgi:flagellar export protein FliJ
MARGLEGIIRYRRYQLDEARRALGVLLREAADLTKRAKDLENEIRFEQATAQQHPEEGGIIYGHYAAHAIERRAALARSIAEIERRIEVQRENVRIEFRELKVLEIAEERREKEEAKKALVAQQVVLDEVGLELFRRRDD